MPLPSFLAKPFSPETFRRTIQRFAPSLLFALLAAGLSIYLIHRDQGSAEEIYPIIPWLLICLLAFPLMAAIRLYIEKAEFTSKWLWLLNGFGLTFLVLFVSNTSPLAAGSEKLFRVQGLPWGLIPTGAPRSGDSFYLHYPDSAQQFSFEYGIRTALTASALTLLALAAPFVRSKKKSSLLAV